MLTPPLVITGDMIHPMDFEEISGVDLETFPISYETSRLIIAFAVASERVVVDPSQFDVFINGTFTYESCLYEGIEDTDILKTAALMDLATVRQKLLNGDNLLAGHLDDMCQRVISQVLYHYDQKQLCESEQAFLDYAGPYCQRYTQFPGHHPLGLSKWLDAMRAHACPDLL